MPGFARPEKQKAGHDPDLSFHSRCPLVSTLRRQSAAACVKSSRASSLRAAVHPCWRAASSEVRRACRPRGLCRLEVVRGGLAGTAVLHNLEVDLLAFDESAHAGPLNGGDVDENVRSTGIRLNEAKTLGGVEELYSASSHDDFSLINRSVGIRQPKPAVQIEIEREDRQVRMVRGNKVRQANSMHGI